MSASTASLRRWLGRKARGVHWSRADIVAGVAVSAYLVPQCLAYARVAGLDPVAGLWAALPGLVLYAVVGTSPLLSIGPESASAVLVGSAVVTLAGREGADPGAVAAGLALAVAALAAAGFVVRAGFLADLLSRPVTVGFLAGIAVTMVGSQLPRLVGIDPVQDATLARLAEVVQRAGEVSWPAALLGAGTVAALAALGRWRAVPGPLVVLAVAALVRWWLDLGARGAAAVGPVPRGLPRLLWPELAMSQWGNVFITAAGITVVAFSGNVVTARAFAHRGDRPLDANRELLAVAVTNAGAGLVGGFPISSSDSRTALAATLGGRSQLVSLTAAGCLALVLLVGGGLVAQLPVSALAGLVIYAATRLVDVREIRRVMAFRSSEGLIMAATFAGVVGFDVLVGIGVAVGLSVADLFRRVARAHDAVQGAVPGLAGLHDVDDYPTAMTVPGLVVYRYDAPLCFANAEDVRARLLAAVDAERTQVEWVVLNMEANVEIDLTAVDMLDELREELERRGVVLALARVKQDLAVYLERTGFKARVGEARIFPTLPTALDAFEQRPH